ncbi:MAG TPA: hypothetical protein VMQ67_11750 [Candidatus Saccharimonadales bacterium]|nr:hypothetical protein [Candidatus Saccharimonadales bacterium]
MGRLFLQWVILLVLGASSSTLAQPDFKATPTTIVMAEGGRESILLVETDHERFSLSIPKDYGMDARAETRSIIFTAGAGASVITVQFATNYAGALPKQNNLRDQVAANHPGASLVASSTFGPAQSFDLFLPAGNGLLLRIRDAYVAYPEGSVELTFSCNSADFDKQKLGFARLLNSFRSLPKDVNKNP